MINESTNPAIGQMVRVVKGPRVGQNVKINKIEFNKGAKNGWFTCQLPDGGEGLFAGEELSE